MKILVPIDGSKYSKKAMAKAKEFGSEIKAEIKLLHVVNPEISIRNMHNRDFHEEINRSTMQHSKEILDEALDFFSDYNGKVTATNIRGDTTETIIKTAETEDYDLVIMGSRGAGVFSRALLGSVSNKVLHHIKTSVMIIK